jgi:amidase
MEGTSPDPHDSATKTCTPPAGNDYTRLLNPRALEGARIGIPRAVFYDSVKVGGSTTPRGFLNAAQKKVMDEAIAVLKAQGAVIVDPADIPSIIAPDPAENFLNWNVCGGLDNAKGLDAGCSIAFKYGMKRDFNAWLASLGDRAPVKSLTADRERYLADRRKDIRLSATNGIDAALEAHRLDALFVPGVSSAGIGARPGYPTVTVPWAFVPVPRGEGANAFPAGFEPKPQPFNVSFTGTACSDPKLITLAFAFEQATKRRVAPPQLP